MTTGRRPGLTDGREPSRAEPVGLRHEALLYSGPEDFVRGVRPFVLEALAMGEPVLVVAPPWNAGPLRRSLGPDAARVEFADMQVIGRNPARIIPAWRDFLDRVAVSGGPVRGVGEPIWAGRTEDEIDECVRHEALLNVAFSDEDFWLLCPYDVDALPRRVIAAARRRHPVVRSDRTGTRSEMYSATDVDDALRGRLPGPPAGSRRFDFGIDDLCTLRLAVASIAREAGLAEDRVSGLVMAANEVATNSVVHGGGRGTLAAWATEDTVLCEIRDAGLMTDPLVGRERAASEDERGRGLWLANQLCDLVQIRSTRSGTVVRMHQQIG